MLAVDRELLAASGERDPVRVRALLAAGANAKLLHVEWFDETSSSDKGTTALHAWAAHMPRIDTITHSYYGPPDYDSDATQEVFALLTDAGADCTQLNSLGSSPLHFANDALAARLLVEQGGVDPDLVNRRGETALHLSSDTAAVRYLLEEAHASPNIETKSGSAMLARLHRDRGTKGGQVDQVHLFLDNGARPDALNWAGHTALHLLAQHGRQDPGDDAARLGLLQRLLSAGVSINIRNTERQTPLHRVWLWHEGPWGKGEEALAAAMLSAGADLEARDGNGQTSLFFLVESRRLPRDNELIALCQFMKTYGADLNTRDDKGRTLCHACAQRGDRGLIQWLVEQGADPTVTDYQGSTLLHESIPRLSGYYYGNDSWSFDFFEDLVTLGVDPLRPNRAGRTPLHVASTILLRGLQDRGTPPTTGSTSLFDWLLDRGGDIDAADAKGVTALHLASTFSEYQARRLLENGADPLKATNEGLSSLHLAARARQPNIVGMLLDAVRRRRDGGSIPEASSPTTVHTRSPLFYACASGRPETAQLLLEAGLTAVNPNGLYTDSALQGCVHFEAELTRWPKGPGHQQWDHRDVGSVALSDDFRMDLQPGPVLSERLEEMLQMLVAADHQGWMKTNVDLAIAEAVDKGAAYTVECLLRVREQVGIRTPSKHNDAILTLLTPRSEARQAFYSHHQTPDPTTTGATAEPSLSAEGFSEAMTARLFDVVQENLTPQDCLQGVRQPHGGSDTMILQYLAKGGHASLLAEVATQDEVAKLDDHAWAEAMEQSTSGGFWPGEIEPLLLTACRRSIPNMQVLRLLVEHFRCNVNAPGRGPGLSSRVDRLENASASALHLLALGGHWWQHAQAIPYLVAHGADADARDDRGMSPLNAVLDRLPRAKLFFSLRAVEVLLALGADVMSADERGVSCIERAKADSAVHALLLEHAAAS